MKSPVQSDEGEAPRSGSSADLAYGRIKEMVLSGSYAAGQRLPEDMIAAELGLSRTPVRDALVRLRAEGLVAITPNSGARVASWTRDELGELTQMRAMLEGYAAELAARKIGPEATDGLDRLCDAMSSAIEARPRPDFDVISRINLDFHRGIAVAADNSRLVASLEPLWNFSVMIRKFALFSAGRRKSSLDHHRELVAALRGRDGDWARTVMQSHIYAARALDARLDLQADGLAAAAATKP